MDAECTSSTPCSKCTPDGECSKCEVGELQKILDSSGLCREILATSVVATAKKAIAEIMSFKVAGACTQPLFVLSAPLPSLCIHAPFSPLSALRMGGHTQRPLSSM